jgi:peptidoglycan-N-acetylglucosamine deacetylase
MIIPTTNRKPRARCPIRNCEFDVAYQEHTMFILTMHPHITGHRSRISGLEKLIVYMRSKPGVWFATLDQVAEYVKAQEKEVRK